jgi:hypothetical protein
MYVFTLLIVEAHYCVSFRISLRLGGSTLSQKKPRRIDNGQLWCWWFETERNNENHNQKRRQTEKLQFLVRQHATEWKGQNKTHITQVQSTSNKWNLP